MGDHRIMKLRQVLILSISILVIGLGVIGSILGYFISQKYIKTEIISTHRQQIGQYLHHVDQLLFERSSDLVLISKKIENIDSSDLDRLETILINYKKVRKAYSSLAIFQDNSKKIVDTTGSELNKRFVHEYINDALNSTNVVLAYEGYENFNNSFLVLSKAVVDLKGRRLVLVGYVPFAKVIDLSNPLLSSNGKKVDVQLIRKSDNTIIYSSTDSWISSDLNIFNKITEMGSAEDLYLSENDDSITFLGKTRISGVDLVSDWMLLIRKNKADLFSLSSKITLLIAASFLILLVPAAIGMFYLGSKIVKPIESISSRLELLGKGNFEVFKIPPDGKNEIADMEKALGLMSKDLERTVSDLSRQSRLAAIGQMAGGIAHEINTPLASIMTRSELMLMQFKANKLDAKKLEEGFGKIQDTVKRIVKIINGMRALSRNDSSDPFVEASVTHLINETADFCKESLKFRDISLIIGPIDKSLVIDCRATQVSQVLLNLINNASDAVKNLSEDKWIKLEAYMSDAEAESLIIKVSNSGPLIPEAIAKRLFDPFFTTKSTGEGTGMGLIISQKIIFSHKGKINVDPLVKHTCFVIQLPLKHYEEKITAAV